MLLGLLAVPATSKALKYSPPPSLLPRDCNLPANFTVSNLTVYTDVDSNKNYTSFSYSDVGTGIDTFCTQNSSSEHSALSKNAWPCDNQDVAFIYNGFKATPELDMIEKACPER